MNIHIQQPQPFDLVGSTILISGNGVGFESHLTITVTEGHDQVTGAATAGSTSWRQFQASIDIPPDTAFKLDRLYVTLADDSGGEDGAPVPSAMVPVLYGPLILPGYTGYWEHTVVSGDSLSSLAVRYYSDSSMLTVIKQANQHMVTDPSLIFIGQTLRIPRND